MDTNSKAVISVSRRGRYQHHPLALKLAVVERTLRPGASVARIAREHGINANQVFLWRKRYREGTLGESTAALLPIIRVPDVSTGQRHDPLNDATGAGSLLIESGTLRLHIAGRPDPETLRRVLAALRQS